MSRKISFTGRLLGRSLRVLVIYPDNEDGRIIARHLVRMNFRVKTMWPPSARLDEEADIVIVNVDPNRLPIYERMHFPGNPAVIAIITYENPTTIDLALDIGATTIIATPIKESGLLSSIVVATRMQRLVLEREKRISQLERKLVTTKQLMDAKSILMNFHGISEKEAYDVIRKKAMASRSSIDHICDSLIRASDLMNKAKPTL